MGCRGSKHALRGGGAPEPHPSVALGTLSLDRAAAMVSLAGEEQEVMTMRISSGRSCVASGCCPPSPMEPAMPDPEEINVWELMEGLEDDEGELEAAPKEEEIDAKLPPPESTRRVVVYLTSIRGVRQTHEDCWAVSAILRSYGVRVDERDLSMHAGYKDELHAALAVPPGRRHGIRLPHVFVDGWYLGGAEEVRGMHESGELAEALQGSCDVVAAPDARGKGGGLVLVEPCGCCGGVRFMPCDDCSGSCKVFDGGAFKRCSECNENGLIRCPIC